MTLLFVDSFDHYVTANLGSKYGSAVGSPAISAGNGRNGTACLSVTGNNQYGQCTGLNSHATYIVGMAVYYSALVSQSDGFLALYDAGTQHVQLLSNAAGNLILKIGDGTTLATTTRSISAQVFHYVELKVTIGDAGSYEIRVNGENWSSGSADTRNGANAVVNAFRVGAIGNTNAATVRIDDLYVCDGAGSTNNDFLGDVRIQAIFPTGNGNTSNLVGSDTNSVDNYLLVDETSPSTADFVESSTVTDKDTYVFGDVTPTTGTVLGVQLVPYAAKTDAGVRSIATIARLSGTEVDSANYTLSTTPQYFVSVHETKPGGGAWSITDVNNAEFGVKVTA